MEHTEALQAIQLQQNGNRITRDDISDVLARVKGTTFASIVQVTKVTTAAKFKLVPILKVTEASVQLFNNIGEFTSVYANAVKRSAAKLSDNDQAAVAAFTAQDNWFEHTDCYSVVKHKTKDSYYLYAIYNKADSVYIHGVSGKLMSKAEVAEYLTPAAARDLLEPYDATLNVTHDVLHTVAVRVTALENVVSIVAQKQLLIK